MKWVRPLGRGNRTIFTLPRNQRVQSVAGLTKGSNPHPSHHSLSTLSRGDRFSRCTLNFREFEKFCSSFVLNSSVLHKLAKLYIYQRQHLCSTKAGVWGSNIVIDNLKVLFLIQTSLIKNFCSRSYLEPILRFVNVEFSWILFQFRNKINFLSFHFFG